MNREAIFHNPVSNYAFPISYEKFKVRLRAGKGDLDRVTLVIGNKYLWHTRKEVPPADYKDTFIEFINPEIEYLSDETVELYEGCLSFPGHNGAITRSKKVKVKAQDRNGNWFELEAENMLARCIQHENDHLNGVTIMDRATHFYEDDYPEDAED